MFFGGSFTDPPKATRPVSCPFVPAGFGEGGRSGSVSDPLLMLDGRGRDVVIGNIPRCLASHLAHGVRAACESARRPLGRIVRRPVSLTIRSAEGHALAKVGSGRLNLVAVSN